MESKASDPRTVFRIKSALANTNPGLPMLTNEGRLLVQTCNVQSSLRSRPMRDEAGNRNILAKKLVEREASDGWGGS